MGDVGPVGRAIDVSSTGGRSVAVQVMSRRRSAATIEAAAPGALVLDVTSRGPAPWVRLSPFYGAVRGHRAGLSHAALVRSFLAGTWPAESPPDIDQS